MFALKNAQLVTGQWRRTGLPARASALDIDANEMRTSSVPDVPAANGMQNEESPDRSNVRHVERRGARRFVSRTRLVMLLLLIVAIPIIGPLPTAPCTKTQT